RLHHTATGLVAVRLGTRQIGRRNLTVELSNEHGVVSGVDPRSLAGARRVTPLARIGVQRDVAVDRIFAPHLFLDDVLGLNYVVADVLSLVNRGSGRVDEEFVTTYRLQRNQYLLAEENYALWGDFVVVCDFYEN